MGQKTKPKKSVGVGNPREPNPRSGSTQNSTRESKRLKPSEFLIEKENAAAACLNKPVRKRPKSVSNKIRYIQEFMHHIHSESLS